MRRICPVTRRRSSTGRDPPNINIATPSAGAGRRSQGCQLDADARRPVANLRFIRTTTRKTWAVWLSLATIITFACVGFISSGPCQASTLTTVVYALGDGADGSTTSRALADYIKAKNPNRFFYLGDVYETGTASEFSRNYEPLYGSIASKTDPVIGNHEYSNRSTGYYSYWANKRGWTRERSKHRSYVDASSGWQIIAYSSETDMAAESAWVAGEIAKRSGTCRIVMAHRGRHVVADTSHSDNTNQESVWSKIINKTAINLVAHNHVYGRLAPLSGTTVIVSGAGGHDLRPLGTQHHTVAASKTGVATATRLVLSRGNATISQVDKNGNVYGTKALTCIPA